MKIKFKKVELVDFQIHRNFVYEFGDGVTLFKGANGVGKTTILNGLTWIISGKDLYDTSDKKFDVLPMDKDNNYIENTEPSGTLWIDIDGISKVFQRKYIGDGKKSTRKYFIDGESQTKGEFDSAIKSIFGEENIYKLLTNINHFTKNLSEKERRDEIVKIIGDVSHDEMITIDERFAALTKLETKEFDRAYSEDVAAKNKEKEEVKALKTTLSTYESKVLSKYSLDPDIDYEKIELLLQESKDKIREMEESINNLGDNVNEISKLQVKLGLKQNEIDNFTSEFEKQKARDIDEVNYSHKKLLENIQILNKEVEDLRTEYGQVNTRKKNASSSVEEDIKKERARLDEQEVYDTTIVKNNYTVKIQKEEDEYAKINQIEVKDTCELCSQPLPKDKVERTLENKMAKLNRIRLGIEELKKEKTSELLKIKNSYDSEREKLNKGLEERIEDRVKSYDIELKSIVNKANRKKEDIKLQETKIEDLKIKLETINKREIDIAKKEVLYEQKAELQEQLNALSNGSSSVFTVDQLKEERLNRDILERQVNDYRLYQQDLKSKKELEQDKKLKQKALIKSEERIDLYREYLQIKNNMLSEKLTPYFNKSITFKLVEFTADDVPKNVFRILVNGVNFDTNVNQGAKIKAGIEFVRFFQKQYDIQLPIFVDELTLMSDDLPELETQIIGTIVGSKNEPLTIVEGVM